MADNRFSFDRSFKLFRASIRKFLPPLAYETTLLYDFFNLVDDSSLFYFGASFFDQESYYPSTWFDPVCTDARVRKRFNQVYFFERFQAFDERRNQ